MSTSNGQATIDLNVNGTRYSLKAPPITRLLDVLRENLRLTGTKEGCGEGECGACSVLIDGKVVNSCLIPVAAVANTNITTIEGISGKTAEALKNAFLRCNGAQCGICTPGMVLAATDLLNKNSTPDVETIKEALSGNLCRCTGYTRIIGAVDEAAKSLRGS
jgi:carbon-monoxide dehydrogenase small subunit